MLDHCNKQRLITETNSVQCLCTFLFSFVMFLRLQQCALKCTILKDKTEVQGAWSFLCVKSAVLNPDIFEFCLTRSDSCIFISSALVVLSSTLRHVFGPTARLNLHSNKATFGLITPVQPNPTHKVARRTEMQENDVCAWKKRPKMWLLLIFCLSGQPTPRQSPGNNHSPIWSEL